MSIFGSSSKKIKVKDLRTPAMTTAESTLSDIMRSPAPTFPVQGTAGMSEGEQMAGEMAQDYAASTPEGMDTLRQYASSSDIMQRPEIQAVISRVMQAGEQETNRLGRKIQIAGGGYSSTGANMLGRSVENTQQMILSTLLPYLEGAQSRQMGAATALANLGESSTLSRISALSTTGALPRMLEQLAENARYAQQMQQINFPYQYTAPVAGQILNAQYPVVTTVTGGEPSGFSQFAPVIGQILGGIL